MISGVAALVSVVGCPKIQRSVIKINVCEASSSGGGDGAT